MTDIKTTENEFRSLVNGWLNEFLSSGSYPFEIATSDPSIIVSGGKHRFPDIQVWINRKARNGFCGMELKPLDILADDKDLLENAAEKARAMSADYFLTWNFREAIIWRTPHAGQPVTHIQRYQAYPAISNIVKPDDILDKSIQSLLRDRTREILDDLSALYRDGHLRNLETDTTFFVEKLKETSHGLGEFVKLSLDTKIGKSAKFRGDLILWARLQGYAAYDIGDQFREMIARQIVYRLLGKIIFYYTLHRHRHDIPAISFKDMEFTNVLERLQEYFEKARQIDYQAVFEKGFADSIPIPAGGAVYLINLLKDFERYKFSQMPQDVIGNVFEKLIPGDERHLLGQYFTRENLVDLITAFCIRSQDDFVLDPTCGTGTFLIRAYDRLKYLGLREHKEMLSHIWGIDIAHFPAELATINLFRQDINDYSNFPHIKAQDFFDVKLGHIFEFPPPKSSAGAVIKMKELMPPFNAIVGNFPFIRQELIEKADKKEHYKSKIVKIIAEEWRAEYPDVFTNGDMKLSGQADIYAYLFFHAGRHLKEGGRMGIITSNSWLDVAYGYELQKFFLRNFKLVAILESRCEPWFEDAAVNTVVTILERCTKKEERNKNSIKFVKIKKRLEELIPWDIRYPDKRWSGLESTIYDIEHPGNGQENDGQDNELALNTGENERFRIRSINQKRLLEELEISGKTAKWGRYLRAPEIYFRLKKILEGKTASLDSICQIRFGIKTGINDFFYLDKDKIEHWGIEKEFLKPVITSPRESESIILSSGELQYKVFLCSYTKSELRKRNKQGALRYISWGEKQETKDGKPWPQVSTVSGRKLWYDLGKRKPGNILLQMITNDRFFATLNLQNVYVDHNLFEVFPPPNAGLKEGLLIYFNSSLFALYRELSSRVNLGEGATKTEGVDWKDIPVPHEEILKSLKLGKRLNDSIMSRAVESIFDEVKRKDRQELDSIVLSALGLNPDEYLQPLYDGLTELVRERIDLAKSRKKQKAVRVQKDIVKLKEQVIEIVLPDGPRKFPADFLGIIKGGDSLEFSIPSEKLELGHYFMGRQEIKSETGFKMDIENPEMAKFIVYSQRPDTYVVRVPKDDKLISKTISQYEKYLRKIFKQLRDEFYNRTNDIKKSEFFAAQVMAEFNLPRV